MASPETNRKIIAVMLFVLPIGLVKGTSLYMGRSPVQSADASAVDSTAPADKTTVVKAPVWTSKQIAASKHIASLREQPFDSTPFLHEHKVQATVNSAPEPLVTSPTNNASLGPPPKFALQMIMSGSSGSTALIDNKPYHIGDEIRDSGWTVTDINRQNRSVTLHEATNDRTMVIAVDMPGANKD
jgi:hypothetical protein